MRELAASPLARGLALVRDARVQDGDAQQQTLARLEALLVRASAPVDVISDGAVLANGARAMHDVGGIDNGIDASIDKASASADPRDEPALVLDLDGYLTGWNACAEALFG